MTKQYLKRIRAGHWKIWKEPFSGFYDEWRQKRINLIVKKFPFPFFVDKTVMELGAGYGHIGDEFSKLGAKVLCVEGRDYNVRTMRKKFPQLSWCVYDLDEPLPFRKFDVILHLGLLYHLKNPAQSIRECSKITNNLILETEVCNLKGNKSFHEIKEKDDGYGFALNGKGVRPSIEYVERCLKQNGFKFERIVSKDLDTKYHKYTWEPNESPVYFRGMRSFWFCWKEETDDD